MSNWAAIATATAALQRWVQQEVANHFGATCTTVRPDQIDQVNPIVNLYLYQVTFNHGYLNIDQPQFRSDGTRMSQAQTAIDLHYLVTCNAKDDEILSQLLLAQSIRVFNAQAILSRKMISDAAASSSNVHVKASDLAKQAESVRVTPLNLGLEELSKIWGLYPDTPSMLSAAYIATTIILLGDDSPEPSLPAQGPAIAATPQLAPNLDSIKTIVAGSDITLQLAGSLFTKDCSVVVDGEATLALPTITASRISVASPESSLPGLKSAHVARTVSFDGRDFVLDSDSQAYVIRPLIDKITVAGGQITVKLLRKVGKSQDAALILSPLAGGAQVVVAFAARAADTKTLKVTSAGVAAGDYLARVRVDGAYSLTGSTGDPPIPSPKVTIP